MKIGKVLLILGAGAACVVTGGLAAPAIGAVVGTTFMGLSGAAATSAGLAALGGGALAAGGAGMAGGTALIQAVAGGIGILGAGIAKNASDGAKAKKQNAELRSELHQQNVDNATKQKVIRQLNNKVEELKQALAEEAAKTNRNEETIRLLQDQLDDVLKTLEVANAA
ncbi:hypothetical protein [uncultured Oscillibacter sp.]|uniref:hypothetical protein n=1 Tax=uncultured Oscillibacter sp. TaxID=876091 RepID=UPI0025FC36F1|nr:hypothetical protein [uncultured Oscillibacter sp.]